VGNAIGAAVEFVVGVVHVDLDCGGKIGKDSRKEDGKESEMNHIDFLKILWFEWIVVSVR
jgi:hypothetical protein